MLGLISPITIQAMVAYRDLFRLDPTPGWDEDIPLKEKSKWLKILQEFCKVSVVTFPRCIAPISKGSYAEIVGFFDGSDNAYAGVAYIRWKLQNDSYVVYLARSK